jgi:hypothetical protein
MTLENSSMIDKESPQTTVHVKFQKIHQQRKTFIHLEIEIPNEARVLLPSPIEFQVQRQVPL